MSALSGINVSSDLATKFADAVQSKSTRFIKVSIENESLVHDISVPITGSLEEDLARFQDDGIISNDSPCYILVKLDSPSPDWMTISYVPDAAKVRDKMLYASTRLPLLKSLGTTLFTDSIFASSKADFSAESYASHLRHNAAPHPLSAREQEIADLRAAESETVNYEGSGARASHIGTGVGLNWSEEVENSVKELGRGSGSAIVVITINPQTETLALFTAEEITVDALGKTLPQTEPSYAFFALPHPKGQNGGREIIFIYSCPSVSPIKHRMLYSSGSTTTYQAAKHLLASLTPTVTLATRKIETSDPKELDEAYLITELGLSLIDDSTAAANLPKAFARPKGPPRRR
ncbi:actin depolymerizing protein [Pholiota conissans]|uniref:Actin depolymerizing protein n=1 Tax=Pholiota conissans TaxID=109636 RepID=A0A9P5ZBV8_9AGAR|nr:actin depolymerizing protein [Pholiota conissans]